MIMAHYGRTPDLPDLRRRCQLGTTGVTLLGISKAAEQMGFRTMGGRLPLETLCDKAPLPLIAHWNQNHFVVVYRVQRRHGKPYRIWVANPAKGRVPYSPEEFAQHWASTATDNVDKGIVLLLEPTEAFHQQTDEPRVATNRLKFLWGYIKQYRRVFVQIILGVLVG